MVLDALDTPDKFVCNTIDEIVPATYDEVLASDHRTEWLEAVSKEYNSLIDKDVLGTPCPLPPGRKVTGCKLVLKAKTDSSGQLSVRKARLTAQGFSQIPGVDYGIQATYAPVAHLDSLRLFFAVAAAFGLIFLQIDFVTAFLNSPLEETIYLKVPPGFRDLQSRIQVPEGFVLPLKKAIYGLKQSNHLWNVNIVKSTVDGLGFTQLVTDRSLFVKWVSGSPQLLLLYVDDCVIASESPVINESIYSALDRDYKCNSLGPVKWLLGFEVRHNSSRRTVSIDQSRYIEGVLHRFAPPGLQLRDFPSDLVHPTDSSHCATSLEDKNFMLNIPYRSLLGCMLWLLVVSRSDIGPTLLHLCKFQNNPGRRHWEALIWLLGYIASTKHLVLTFGGISAPQLRLLCFCDSNYEKSDFCKCTSGYVITLGGIGSICWSSKYQETTAQSSTEAEYVALTPAVKQIIWLRMMLSELQIPADPNNNPTIIYCDNSSAIKLTSHEVAHGRSKHINIRYHFIRDHILAGEIQVLKIHTSENRADQQSKMTQALPLFNLQRSLNLGL